MIGTKYRFRHYRRTARGRSLIWASDGPAHSETFPLGEIPAGSPLDVEVARAQLWTPNNLVDEGEGDILDVYFVDQAVRSSLFFRLFNDTPVETDGLSDLTGEVSGTGYGAITVTRGTDWSEPALDSGDMQTSTGTKTFSAGGTWTDATHLILATSSDNSGLLIAFAALSTTRQLEDGDTLDVDMSVKLA